MSYIFLRFCPLVLLAAACLRFNLISFCYLWLFLKSVPLLTSPFFFAWFWRTLLVLSWGICLTHTIFQALLAFDVSITPSPALELFGLSAITDVISGIRMIGTDVVVCIYSTVCFCLGPHNLAAGLPEGRPGARRSVLVDSVFCLLLVIAGAAHPSALCVPYVFWFLFVGLRKPMCPQVCVDATLLVRVLTFYTAVHVCVLYLYQLTPLNSEIASPSADVLGLVVLLSDPQDQAAIVASIIAQVCVFCFASLFGPGQTVVADPEATPVTASTLSRAASMMSPNLMSVSPPTRGPVSRRIVSRQSQLRMSQLDSDFGMPRQGGPDSEHKMLPPSSIQSSVHSRSRAGSNLFLSHAVAQEWENQEHLLTRLLRDYGRPLCYAAVAAVSVLFPSALSFGLACIFCVLLYCSKQWFLLLVRPSAVYSLMMFLLQYVFAIPHVATSSDYLVMVGLKESQHYDLMVMASLCVVWVLMAYLDVTQIDPSLITIELVHQAARIGDRFFLQEAARLRPPLLTGMGPQRRSLLHSAVTSGKETVAKLVVQLLHNDPLFDPNAKDLEGNTPLHLASKLGYEDVVQYLLTLDGIQTDILNRYKQTYLNIDLSVHKSLFRKARAMRRMLLNICVHHLEKLIFCVVFLFGLSKADFIHMTFLGFVIIFLVFPTAAVRAWTVLLVYSMIALLLVYAFPLFLPGAVYPGSWPDIIGIDPVLVNQYALKLAPYYLLLVLVSVQAWVFRQFPDAEHGVERSVPKPLMGMSMALAYLTLLVKGVWYGEPTTDSLIGLVFLMIAILIHQCSKQPVPHLTRLWFVVVLYSAIFLFSEYAFQFADIRNWLQALLPKNNYFTLDDIGFKQKGADNEQALLGYLFPGSLSFIFSVVYFKLLIWHSRRSPHPSSFFVTVPWKHLIDVVRQCTLVVLLIITWTEVVTDVSLINCAYLCVMVIHLALGVEFLWFSLTICASLVIVSKYLAQFNFFVTLASDSPGVADWLGFHDFNHYVLQGLYGDLMILAAAALHRVLQRIPFTVITPGSAAETQRNAPLLAGMRTSVQSISENGCLTEEVLSASEVVIIFLKTFAKRATQDALWLWLNGNAYFGVHVCLTALVFLAIYRANALSLVYCGVLACYVFLGIKNFVKHQLLWRLFVCALGVLLVTQYLIVLGPSDKSWLPPWDKLSNNVQLYLLLGAYKAPDLHWDFVCVGLFGLQLQYLLPATEHVIVEENVTVVVLPPTATATEHQRAYANEIWGAARFVILLASDKLVAVIIFAMGINSADILSLIYILSSLYLLFDSSYLTERSKQKWKYVAILNWLYVGIQVAYQIPAEWGVYLDDPTSEDFPHNLFWGAKIIGLQKFWSKNQTFQGFDQDTGPRAAIFIFLLTDIQLRLFGAHEYLAVHKSYEVYRQEANLRAQESASLIQRASANAKTAALRKMLELDNYLQSIWLRIGELKYVSDPFPDGDVWPNLPREAHQDEKEIPPQRKRYKKLWWQTRLLRKVDSVQSGTEQSVSASQVSPKLEEDFCSGSLRRPTNILTGNKLVPILRRLERFRRVQFHPGEHLLFHYCNRAGPAFLVGDQTEDCVLLTNQRALQIIEGLVCVEWERIALQKISIQTGGLFGWELLKVESSTGEAGEMKIWNRSALKFFATVLIAGIPGHEPLPPDYEAKWITSIKSYLRSRMVSKIDPSLWKPIGKSWDLQRVSTLVLVFRYLASNTMWLCFGAYILTFFVNADVLAFVPFLVILAFGAIEHPRPSKSFWIWCAVYSSTLIALKLLFQLQPFCIATSTDYADSSRYYVAIEPDPFCPPGDSQMQPYETPHLMGLSKLPSGYGFASAVFLDIFCILLIIWHRALLIKKGVWRYSEKEMIELTVIPVLAQMKENRRKKKEAALREVEIVAHEVVSPHEDHEKEVDFVHVEEHHVLPPNVCEEKPAKPWKYKILSVVPREIVDFFMSLDPPVRFTDPEPVCGLEKRIRELSIKKGKDFYLTGFVSEFLSALFLLFFYERMATSNNANLEAVFTQNLFSGRMVAMFFLQVALIIIDRTIYLKRSVKVKWLHHCFSLVFWNYTIFFNWTQSAQEAFKSNLALQTFFIIKCWFFITSALQIKEGYPPDTETPIQNLTKEPGYIRSVLFSIYRAIPIVFELRTLLDWMNSTTALNLWEVFKLEDIDANLFITQCNVIWMRERKRGTPEPLVSKIINGFLFFFALLFVLLFPLLLFSSANPAAQNNNVQSADLTVSLGNSYTSFTLLTNNNVQSINPISLTVWQTMTRFSIVYDEDISTMQSIVMNDYPDTFWQLTPPALDALKDLLRSEGIRLSLQYAFQRPAPPTNKNIAGYTSILLNASQRADFIRAIESTGNSDPITIPGMIPKYLRLPLDGSPIHVEPIERMPGDDTNAQNFADIVLDLNKTEDGSLWWTVGQPDPESLVTLVTISTPSFNQLVAAGVGYSLVGIYVGIVLTIGRLVRFVFANSIQRIFYEDAQNMSALLMLCEGIYIARHKKQLLKEEELYRRLVYILRNPELLIRLTRRSDDEPVKQGPLATQ